MKNLFYQVVKEDNTQHVEPVGPRSATFHDALSKCPADCFITLYREKKGGKIEALDDFYPNLLKSPPIPKIVIVVEGGMVQEVISDYRVKATKIDYDTDGVDAGDVDLKDIPQANGKTASGYADEFPCDVMRERVEELWNAIN